MRPASYAARSASGNSTLIKGRLSKESGEGLYPAFSASGQDVWHSEYSHDGTAIILSAVGARCGKCFLAKGKWSAIANTHIIWPNIDTADPEYLFFLLNNEAFWIRGGSAQPFVKIKDSLNQKIPLPPIEEQHRIVSRIKECMERVEEIERLRKQAIEEIDATLPSLLNETFLNLTEAYEMVEIGDVAAETRYGTSRKCSTIPKGTAILRIPNVAKGFVNFDNIKYCSLEAKELKYLTLKKGDLLFVRTNGSRDLVGRCAIYEGNGDNQEHGFASYLIRVRLEQDKVRPHFLAFFLNSTHGRTELDKRRRTSAGQFNINSENLRNIKVPLPPIDVQDKLIEVLNDRQIKVHQIQSESTIAQETESHLRESILRKAFAGEL